MEVQKEILNDEFTKYILSFHESGFHPAIHHFTNQKRHGGDIHDHPFDFTTHVIKGGYIERVYKINEDGTWDSEIVHRKEGTVNKIQAEHIHEILELPEGECFTLVIAGPPRNRWKFWRFDDKASYRYPDEPDFQEYKP